jgi:hypothetical protein
MKIRKNPSKFGQVFWGYISDGKPQLACRHFFAHYAYLCSPM